MAEAVRLSWFLFAGLGLAKSPLRAALVGARLLARLWGSGEVRYCCGFVDVFAFGQPWFVGFVTVCGAERCSRLIFVGWGGLRIQKWIEMHKGS